MSHASPSSARDAHELTETLTTLGDGEELNEWAIQKLARDARGLMKEDPVGAHIVLGGIAALRGQVAQVHRHNEIALQLSGDSLQALRNCATSLSRVGEMDEAFEVTLKVLERAPADLPTLRAALMVAVQSAHFRKGCDLYYRWNELCPDQPMGDEASVNRAAEAIDNHAFSEEAAQRVIRLAHEVRRSANVRTAGAGILALHGEGDSFLFEVKVRGTTRDAVELNEEFADRIATDEELMTDPGGKFVLVFIGTRTNGSDSRATP